MIARTIVIVAALALAIAVALVFLPIAALVDPVTRAAGAAFSVSSIFTLFAASFFSVDPDRAGADFLFAVWTVAMMVCVAPVIVVALIGEVAGMASVLWYVGATGLAAAGFPWIARTRRLGEAGAAAGQMEARLALIFFLTGAVAGLVYWLIAGQRAGRALPQR